MSRTTDAIAILKAGPLTPNQLAEKLKLPRHEVQRLLSDMKARALVERVDEKGSGKGAIYALATKDRPPRKPTHPTSVWTAELIAEATRLNDLGLSASEIAGKLGLGLSRHSVIGKFWRLGVIKSGAGRSQATSDDDMRQRITARKKREKAPRAAVVPKPTPTPPKPQPAAEHAPGAPGGIPLMQLGARQCKWAVGYRDGEHLFCAAGRDAGQPYCRSHSKMAIQPKQKTGTGMRLERLAVGR